MRRGVLSLAVVLVLLAIAGCGDDASSGTSMTTADGGHEELERRPKPEIVLPQSPPPRSLYAEDLIKGKGAKEVEATDVVTVDFVAADYETGREVASSFGREPVRFEMWGQAFPIGVFRGLGHGLYGGSPADGPMRVGGRRRLLVPAYLTHGRRGNPPNSGGSLIVIVDVLDIEKPSQ